MVKKNYDWINGAVLGDHSESKLKILREYIFDYLTVRCQLPQQTRFRLAIVDGFCGGGCYKGNISGSPLIFIEELQKAIKAINLTRSISGLSTIEIECLLIFNDYDKEAIDVLKTNIVPLLMEIKQNCTNLNIHVSYMNDKFEDVYPLIKQELINNRYRNVLFNLDQCGHSHVRIETITDIMRSFFAPEIFFTFMISSLLTYLPENKEDKIQRYLSYLDLTKEDLKGLDGFISNPEWFGRVEKLVFQVFSDCCSFNSPFSINNPDGWRYWFIHFSNAYRARQVYNNILHDNATSQAHFGRSGLNMLSYDPRYRKGELYLFDDDGRKTAKDQLINDIPALISEFGDALPIFDFYTSIYNTTPAHSDDIHQAIIESPDLEIITKNGGERRKANTISITDTIKLKKQKSFFSFL